MRILSSASSNLCLLLVLIAYRAPLQADGEISLTNFAASFDPVFATLLTQPEVQDELEISKSQSEELFAILTKYRDEWRKHAEAFTKQVETSAKLEAGKEPVSPKNLRLMNQEYSEKILAILQPKQQGRFLEIYLRTRAKTDTASVLLLPIVRDKLKLADEQVEQLEKIEKKATASNVKTFLDGRETVKGIKGTSIESLRELKKFVSRMQEKQQISIKDSSVEALKVLNEEQKTTFEKIQGPAVPIKIAENSIDKDAELFKLNKTIDSVEQMIQIWKTAPLTELEQVYSVLLQGAKLTDEKRNAQVKQFENQLKQNQEKRLQLMHMVDRIDIVKDYELMVMHYNRCLNDEFLKVLKEQAPRKINAWRESSNSGSPEGMWLYGECLKKGVVVNIDKDLAFKFFMSSAKLGNSASMTEVGQCYLKGNGIERDHKEGIRWLRNAADENCAEAMRLLSYYYDKGEKGFTKDPYMAFAYCQKSSELGNMWSLAELGVYYCDGKVAKYDRKEAFKLFSKAAEAGETFGMTKVGEFYLAGVVVQKDENKGFSLIFKAAQDSDNDLAKYLLGDCYRYGKGVDKNEYEAFNWYEKAAILNNMNAIDKIADCYFYGIGCDKDPTKAFENYEKAAELGSASSLNMLGIKFYSKGLIVEKNLTKAIDYYEKAANKDYEPAMINLSDSYLIGEGVPKDPSKAFFWCEKAADLGFSIALNNLGYYFYRTGLVVSKDGHKAFELYTKAAANGNAPAMVNLGASYEDGFGAPRNLKQAIYWYRQAASKGQVEGKDALNRLGYSE